MQCDGMGERELYSLALSGKDNQEGSTANVSVENFQCMLQRQANALIQLGYNPSLKVLITLPLCRVVVIMH